GEVRERERVPRAASASMEAKPRPFRGCLPALAVRPIASLQLDPEELRPETFGALGIIRRKLDQGQWNARHAQHSTGARVHEHLHKHEPGTATRLVLPQVLRLQHEVLEE